MTCIQLENISKHFPDGNNQMRPVLNDINLTIGQHEFAVIKGPSGSGKTTLLNILGTLITPDEGHYFLNNRNVFESRTDFAEIRNKQIGFVFQDHRLLPQYTVLENILLPLLAFSNRINEADLGWARELMNLTGIPDIANQYPQTISGGEAGRTAVCRALIRKPLLLLADEPTGQLDSENAHKILQLLRTINQELKTTIVMVTHAETTLRGVHQQITLKDGIIQ